jgi:hypothetical protein
VSFTHQPGKGAKGIGGSRPHSPDRSARPNLCKSEQSMLLERNTRQVYISALPSLKLESRVNERMAREASAQIHGQRISNML